MTERPALSTRVIEFALNNSLLLVFGAVAALVWANVDPGSYQRVSGTLYFGVDDIGMVFFFALAAKEVYEATLPGGPLSSPKRAAVPLLAAAGGMVVPAGLYAALVVAIGRGDLVRGFAVPCATDIAFAYLVVRLIFPRGHPAIPFLLLLAIADDALGLILLAAFYPSGPVSLGQFAMWVVPAIAIAWWLRRMGVNSFWVYLGPGVLSWIGFFRGGFHPALAMVPIVPFMPHHRSDLLELAEGAVAGVTTLQEFEQWWRVPVQIILLFFGLANAGVPITGVGAATWIVAVSLIVGKPLGILLTTVAAGWLGFRRSEGLDLGSVLLTGIAAGIGFTVALFFATAAFSPGPVQDQAKIGALVSFLAAPLAIGVGRLVRGKRAR
ncbi:MAG: Na+/H+ antiporter NhaA [Vicinamibacterales bacterium]